MGDQQREWGRLQLRPGLAVLCEEHSGQGGGRSRRKGPPQPLFPEAAPGEAALGAEPQQRGPRGTCWALRASAPQLAAASQPLAHRHSDQG